MRKSGRVWLVLAACGVLVLAIVVWNIYERHREEAAGIFFSSALQQQKIDERVIVDNVAYTVSSGQVERDDHGTVTARENFDALRIAYALAVAQRSPLLAIPETDPDKLDHVAGNLQKVAEDLSAVQKSTRDAEAVRTALYPIDFLHAVAAVERQRQAFIASGSVSDEVLYERDEWEAITAYKKDLQLYETAFKDIVPQDTAAYQVFEGTITRTSIISSMSSLMRGIQKTAIELTKQNACVSGALSACDTSRLALPATVPISATQQPDAASKNAASLLDEIRSSYVGASGNAAYATGPVLELAESACLSNFDAPFFFTLQDRDRGVAVTLTPEFMGDIFFVPTAKFTGVPYYSYFAQHGISYVYFPIWEHYKCPELELDTSRVFETQIIRSAAQSERFSQYAKGTDATELRKLEMRLTNPPSGIVEERDALAYITLSESALSQQPGTPSRVMETLQDMLLANKYGTARFEQFIQRVVGDEALNIGLMRANVPVELDAEYLFYVTSGYFSLFLGTNPSVAGVQPPPVEQATSSTPESPFVRYSTLRATIPQAELVSDMKFFFQIHIKASGEAQLLH